MDGANVVAKSLADQGIRFMFGIVGIPVIEVAIAAQQYGIKFIAMRNEQAVFFEILILGIFYVLYSCCYFLRI